MEFVNSVMDFVREGIETGFHDVNSAIPALVIAIIATLLMKDWKRIFVIALGAVVVNVIYDILQPVMMSGGKLQLPQNLMEMSFWKHLAFLYLGYFVVISVLFFIKKKVLKA